MLNCHHPKFNRRSIVVSIKTNIDHSLEFIREYASHIKEIEVEKLLQNDREEYLRSREKLLVSLATLDDQYNPHKEELFRLIGTDEKYLTASQIAKLYNISAPDLRMAAIRDEIKTIKVGNKMLINVAEALSVMTKSDQIGKIRRITETISILSKAAASKTVQ
jgi:hypothetical protein